MKKSKYIPFEIGQPAKMSKADKVICGAGMVVMAPIAHMIYMEVLDAMDGVVEED